MLENWTKGQKAALIVGGLFFLGSCFVFTVAGGYFVSQGGLEKLSGGQQGPASAEDVEAVARWMPADAAGFLWAESLDGGLRTMDDGFKGMERAEVGGELSGRVGEAREWISEEFNFKLSDSSTWSNTGLELGAPLAMTLFGDEESGMEDGRGVALVAKVADHDTFERWVAGSKSIREETVDGKTYRSMEEPPLVWAFREGTVILGAGDAETVASSRELVAESLAAREADETVSGDATFEQFRRAVAAEDGMTLYAPGDGQLMDSFFHGFRQGADDMGPRGEATLRQVRDEITGVGLGLRADGPEEGRARVWVGLSDEGRELAEQMTTATEPYDWAWLTTAQTAAAMRIATPPAVILEKVKGMMTEEELAEYESGLEKIRQTSGGSFDLEADFIEALTGQIGLFLYDAGGDTSLVELADSNPMAALQQAKFAVGLQFRDAASLKKLLETINDGLGKAGMPKASRKPLKDPKGGTVEEVFVYDASVPMAPRVYQVRDVLVIAPTALAPATVASLIQAGGDRQDGARADFASREHANGLYLNVGRLEGVLGASAAEEMGRLEVLTLYSHVDENGAWLQTEWTLGGGRAQ